MKSIVEKESRVVIGQKLGWLGLLAKGANFAVAGDKGLVNIRCGTLLLPYSQNFVQSKCEVVLGSIRQSSVQDFGANVTL